MADDPIASEGTPTDDRPLDSERGTSPFTQKKKKIKQFGAETSANLFNLPETSDNKPYFKTPEEETSARNDANEQYDKGIKNLTEYSKTVSEINDMEKQPNRGYEYSNKREELVTRANELGEELNKQGYDTDRIKTKVSALDSFFTTTASTLGEFINTATDTIMNNPKNFTGMLIDKLPDGHAKDMLKEIIPFQTNIIATLNKALGFETAKPYEMSDITRTALQDSEHEVASFLGNLLGGLVPLIGASALGLPPILSFPAVSLPEISKQLNDGNISPEEAMWELGKQVTMGKLFGTNFGNALENTVIKTLGTGAIDVGFQKLQGKDVDTQELMKNMGTILAMEIFGNVFKKRADLKETFEKNFGKEPEHVKSAINDYLTGKKQLDDLNPIIETQIKRDIVEKMLVERLRKGMTEEDVQKVVQSVKEQANILLRDGNFFKQEAQFKKQLKDFKEFVHNNEGYIDSFKSLFEKSKKTGESILDTIKGLRNKYTKKTVEDYVEEQSVVVDKLRKTRTDVEVKDILKKAYKSTTDVEYRKATETVYKSEFNEVITEEGLSMKYKQSNINPNEAKTYNEEFAELFPNMPRQGRMIDILDEVVEKTGTKVDPELFEVLKDIARETGTTYDLDIADKSYFAGHESSIAISYQKMNLVGFNTTAPMLKETPEQLWRPNIAGGFIHEMIHIGLRNVLTDYNLKGTNDPTLENELIGLIADFENHIFKLNPNFKHSDDSKYALQPIEFLNFVFQDTDSRFAKGLNQMSSPDRQSWLKRFFDWVKKALGLKTKTAFDYAKELIMKHLKANLEQTKSYAERMEKTKYDYENYTDADMDKLFGQETPFSLPLSKPNFKQDNMEILTARSSALDYTQDQIRALQMTEKFLGDSKANFMLLEGYAGTGKTTLVENIINFARSYKSVGNEGGVISAITNKAVRVLDSKLLSVEPRIEGMTLHALLYMPQDAGKGKVKFTSGEGVINGLLIVDEASMISNGGKNEDIRIFTDIIDAAIKSKAKVIFIGDSFQLPPVDSSFNIFGDASNTFGDYHAMMSQVKRIKGGTILDYVTALRTKKNTLFIPVESSGNLIVSNMKTSQSAFNELVMADQDVVFVTATNKARIKINVDTIKLKYPKTQAGDIHAGQPLLVVNNANPVFKNGEILTFGENVKPIGQFQFKGTGYGGKPTYSNFYAVMHNGGFFLFSHDSELASVHVAQLKYGLGNQWQELANLYDKNMPKSDEKKGKFGEKVRNISVVYPAYAITAHKSQGSQWKNVFVNQDYVFPGNIQDSVRWLYTAATRASEKLTLIPNSHIIVKWRAIEELLAQQDVHKEVKGDVPSTFGVPKGFQNPVEEKVIETKLDTDLIKSVDEYSLDDFLNEKEQIPEKVPSIQMQPDNIAKIEAGIKTTTIRSKEQAEIINIPVETEQMRLIGGKPYMVYNDGYVDVDHYGKSQMLQSEGVKSIDELKYQQSKDWFNGKGKMYVYTIYPIEQKDKTEPSVPKKNQQDDLKQNLSTTTSDKPVVRDNEPTFKTEYLAKLIFGTPGIGKTQLVKMFPHILTDMDDLLVNAILAHNPKANVNNDTIGKFIAHMYNESDKMDRANKNKVEAQIEAYYNAALVGARKLVKSGRSVLTGSTRFLLTSDVAFISNDPIIIARRYADNAEQIVPAVIRKQQEKIELAINNEDQELVFLKDGEVLYDKLVQDVPPTPVETPVEMLQDEIKNAQQETTQLTEELTQTQTTQTMENVSPTTEPAIEEVEAMYGVDATDAEKLLAVDEPTEEQEEIVNESSLSTNNLVQAFTGADGRPVFSSYEELFDFVQDTADQAGRDDIASFQLFLDLYSEKAGFIGRSNQRIMALNDLYAERDAKMLNGRSWLHTEWHKLINKQRKNLAIVEYNNFQFTVKKITSDSYTDSQGKGRKIIQQGLTYTNLIKGLAEKGIVLDFYEVAHFANLYTNQTAIRIDKLGTGQEGNKILYAQRNLVRNGYVLILESKMAGVIDLNSIKVDIGNIHLRWNQPEYSDYVKKNKAEYWNFGKVVLLDPKNTLFKMAMRDMATMFPEFKNRKVADYYESKTPQGLRTINDYVVNYNKYTPIKDGWKILKQSGFDDAVLTNIVSDIIHQFVFRGVFWKQILPSASSDQKLMKRIQLGGNLSTATLTNDILASLPTTSVGNPIWIDKSSGISRVKVRAVTLSEDVKFKIGNFTFVDGSQYVLPEFAQVYNDANIVDYDKRGTCLKARQFEIDLFRKYGAFVVVPGTPIYKFMIDNSIAVIEPESTIKIGRATNPVFKNAPFVDYEDITNDTIVPIKATYEIDLKDFAYIKNNGAVKTENRDFSTWLWSVGSMSILSPSSLTALTNLHNRGINSLQSKIQNWHNPETFAKTIYRTYSNPNSFESTTKNFVLDFLKTPEYKYTTYYPQLVDNFLSSTYTRELQNILKFRQFGSRPVLKLETFGMEDIPNIVKGFNNKTDDEKQQFFDAYCEKHSDGSYSLKEGFIIIDAKTASIIKVSEEDRGFTICNPASDFSDTRAIKVVGIGKVNYFDGKMSDGNWIMGATKTLQILSGKDGDDDEIGFVPVDYKKKNDKFTDKDLEVIWKDVDAIYKSGKVQSWFDKFEEGYEGKAKSYNQQMKRTDIDPALARIIDWFGASEEMRSGVNLYNPEQTAEMMSMLITNQIGIVYNARRLYSSIAEVKHVELLQDVVDKDGVTQSINLKIEVDKTKLGENLVFLRHLSHYVLDALSTGKLFTFNFNLPMIYNKIFNITDLNTGKETTLTDENYKAFKQFETKYYVPLINLTADIEKEGIYQGIEQFSKLLNGTIETLDSNPFKDTFVGKFVASLNQLQLGKLKLTADEVKNIEKQYKESVYDKQLVKSTLEGGESKDRRMIRRFNYILNRVQTATNSSSINRHKPSKDGNLWTDDAIFYGNKKTGGVIHETVNNLIKLRQNGQDLINQGNKINNPITDAYFRLITEIFRGKRYLLFDEAKQVSFAIGGNSSSKQVYSFINNNGVLEYRYDFYLQGEFISEQSWQKDNWEDVFKGVHKEQLTSIIMKPEYQFIEKMFDKNLKGAMIKIEKNNNIQTYTQWLVKDLYKNLVNSDDFKTLSPADQRIFFELTTGVYDKYAHRYSLTIGTELLKSVIQSRELDEFELLALQQNPDMLEKNGEELRVDNTGRSFADKITRTNNVLNAFTLANSVTDVNSVASEFVNQHLTILNNIIGKQMGFETDPDPSDDVIDVWNQFEEGLGMPQPSEAEELSEIEEMTLEIERLAKVPHEKYDIPALIEASFNLKLTRPKVIKYVKGVIIKALKAENKKHSVTRGVHNIIPIPEIINIDSKKVNIAPTFGLKGGIRKVFLDDFVNIQDIQAFEIEQAFNTGGALSGISRYSNAQLVFLINTYIQRHVLEKESYFRQIFNNGVVRTLATKNKDVARINAVSVVKEGILVDAYDIAAKKDSTKYLKGFNIAKINVKAIIESLEQGFSVRYGDVDSGQQKIERTFPQTLFKVNHDELFKLAREYYDRSPHVAANEINALNSISVAIIYRLVFDKVIPDLISVHVSKLEWLLRDRVDTIQNSMLKSQFMDNIKESIGYWTRLSMEMAMSSNYMPEFEKHVTMKDDKDIQKSADSLLDSEITRDPFDTSHLEKAISTFENQKVAKDNVLKDSKMLNRFLNTISSVMRKQLFEGYRLADLELLSTETPFIQNLMSRQISGTLHQHEYLRKTPAKNLKVGQDAMVETDTAIVLGTVTKIQGNDITMQWKDTVYNETGVQEVLVQAVFNAFDIRNSAKYSGVSIQHDIAIIFRELENKFGKGFLKDKIHLADFGESLSEAITIMSTAIIKTGSKAMLGFKPLFQLTNYAGGTMNNLVYFGYTTYFNHQAPIDLKTFTQSNDLKKEGAVSQHDIEVFRQVTNNMSWFMGEFEFILGALGDTISSPETATKDELEFIEKTRGATNIFKLAKELANLRKTFARITGKADPDEGTIRDLINFSERFDRFYNKAGFYNIPLGFLFQKFGVEAARVFSDARQGEEAIRTLSAGTMVTYIVDRNNELNRKMPDELLGSIIPRIALAAVDNCVRFTQLYYTRYLYQSTWGSDPFTKMFEWFAHYPVSMSFNLLHTIFNTMRQFSDFGGRRVIASSYLGFPAMRSKQQITNKMYGYEGDIKLYDVEKNEIIESMNVTQYKGNNGYVWVSADGKQHMFKYASLNQLNRLIRMLAMAMITFLGTVLNATLFRKLAYDFMYIKSYSIFYQLFTEPMLRSQSIPVLEALFTGLSAMTYDVILQRAPTPTGDSKKEREDYEKAQSWHEKLFDTTNKDKYLYRKRITLGDDGSKVHKNDESDEIMAAYAHEFEKNLISTYTKTVMMGVGAQKIAELAYMIFDNHYTQDDLKPYMWNMMQMIIPGMRLTSSIGGALVKSGSDPYGLAGLMEAPLGMYEKKSDELMNRRYKRNYLEKQLEKDEKLDVLDADRLTLEQITDITNKKEELDALIESETKK